MRSRFLEYMWSVTSDAPLSIEFSPYVNEQVESILKHGCNDQAVDRKYVEGITIDGAESLDLDDAIWAERTKFGYSIWIHIADVTEYVDMYTPIDVEAFRRTTSIYRKDSVISMIPEALSNNKLSLYQANDKIDKTMSVQIDLDDQFEKIGSQIFESDFKNLKQYNYESFAEDFINPDTQYYSQLHLLKEISDWLRAQRMMNGGWFYLDDDRRTYLGEKINKPSSPIKNIAHDIIEAHAVAANMIVWNYMIENELPWIYKVHNKLNEMSFYSSSPWFHSWLWIWNYTHFTSPIRRYPDNNTHRTVKAHIRWEPNPFLSIDNQLISTRSNQMRFHIETERKILGLEEKGLDFITRNRKRLWRDLEVYDFKHQIRSWEKMAQCVKSMIIEKIESWNIANWSWSIYPILISGDPELQDILYQKIIHEHSISPHKVLNILTHQQLFEGDIPIFEMKQVWDYMNYVYSEEDYLNEAYREVLYGIEFYFKWHKIISYNMNTWKLWDLLQIKRKVKEKIVFDIFKYFIN